MRRRSRPISGSTLATASPAASAMPRNGSGLIVGANATSPSATIAAASAGSANLALVRPIRSSRQRSSGPTAITSSIGTKKIAPIGLKYGGPTETFSPNASVSNG